jgi:uncharacterized protein
MNRLQESGKPFLPRLLSAGLKRTLEAMPVVVVTGARQTGKSTLTHDLLGADRRWHTLDDLDTLELARVDPAALVGGATPTTIDEIQRDPRLLVAIKLAVDEDRTAGKFLLTGSANLLLMRGVSESLAGRAAYLVLRPMTRGEQLGRGSCGLWEALLTEDESRWIELIRSRKCEWEDWRQLAKRGGFPTPAVHMTSEVDREIWFDGYVKTYLERDVRGIGSISALPDFRRLMRASCLRLGQLLNQTELGRDIGMRQPSVHRYMNLLEVGHLLQRLPAYSVNRTKRLVKSPKLFWGDTGLALHLAGVSEPTGSHLENIVLNDLLAWSDSRPARTDIHYWRTSTGIEVDLVVESNSALLPIEVKSGNRVRLSDTSGLRTFHTEYADSSRAGLLLHDGDRLEWLTPRVLAVPWWQIL